MTLIPHKGVLEISEKFLAETLPPDKTHIFPADKDLLIFYLNQAYEVGYTIGYQDREEDGCPRCRRRSRQDVVRDHRSDVYY